MRRFGTQARSLRATRLAAGALMAAALPLVAPALSSQALASSCEALQTHLVERKNLVSSIQAMTQDGKKMEPKAACAAFGTLAANGRATLTWAEANKDGCKIPDNFVEGLKADHDRVARMRERACELAAKARAPSKWHQGPPGSPTPPEFSPGIMDWMPHWLPRPAPASIPWATG